MNGEKFGLMTKMIAFGSVLAVMSVATGLSGYYFLDQVTQPYQRISQVTAPSMSAINEVISFSRFARVNARTLLVPGVKAEQKEVIFKSLEAAVERVSMGESAYDSFKKEDAEESALWTKIKSYVDAEHVLFTAILNEHKSNTLTNSRLMELAFNQDFEIETNLKPIFKKVIDFHERRFQSLANDANGKYVFGNRALASLIVIAVFASLIFAYIMAKTMSGTFIRISDRLLASADEVQIGSSQVSASSQQLSSGAVEAAASLEETVASIEELNSMVKLNAEAAAHASQLSESSESSAALGGEELTRLCGAVDDIAHGSKKIEEIINVIDEIAFQTNLLALNAAVEAARAGDQGKGFAVVADAVRTLAQRSALAAKDINSLIKESVEKAENGSKIAGQCSKALKAILDSVQKVAKLNTEIAAGSREQSTGLMQISQAMNQLDQATQSNAAAAEEVAATAEDMASQASLLRALVTDLKETVNGSRSISIAK